MGIAEDRRGPSGKILPGLKMDLEEALRRLREVFARKGVVLAYLFGSYAEGTATPKSDLDIAVLVESERGDLYESYRELLLAVREALGTERFDLLLLNGAPLPLRFEVVSRGRLIYCRDEDELNEFEMDVIRKFQDTAYLRAVQDEYRKERAKQWYVTERLKKLEEVLEKLREKADVTLEEYQRDTELQWMIERGLELASSAILDVGNHILAGMYGISVDEYEEILEKLCEKAVISTALYQELRGLDGFQNILVHGYLKLSPELVYKHFQKALSTFPKFMAEIESWLEKQGGA